MALLGDSKQAAWQRQTNRVTDRAHTAETHTYCNSPLPSRTIQPVNDAEDQRRLHISQKHTALKYPSAEVNEISRISPLELRQPCLSLRGERRERESCDPPAGRDGAAAAAAADPRSCTFPSHLKWTLQICSM